MRLIWTLGAVASAAALLRLLRYILSPGQDDEEQRFDEELNRTDWDYTPISSPVPTSTSKSSHASNTAGDPLQYRLYRDDVDDRTLLPPARSSMDSRGNWKPPAVASHGGGNQTLFSSTGSSEKPIASTPFSSSVIRVPSNPSPASKPSPPPISSTNINTSVIKLSIGPEKLQIAKDSATCSPSAAPMPLRFQTPSISSSAAPAPSSKKPYLSAVSSTDKISAVGIPIWPEKPQSSSNSAIRTPERSHVGTLLSKFPSPSVSSSTTDSSSPTLQSKVSLSTKLSPAPPSKPSPAPIPTVNSSYSEDGGRVWRKKKQSSTASLIRESQQNIYSASLSSIKIPSPDSSSSGSSSPSRTPDPRRNSNRRVLSKYEIPKYLEEMIKKDIVPPILKCPLSPLTYRDYFATLLYAEDFYIEKWSEYLLNDVALELRPRDGHSRAIAVKRKNSMPDSKDYIAFKLDDVPERRPFLLSRDFVFLQPQNSSAEPFKGILFRVVRGVVLVEFGDNFHSQHSPSKRYDVSFSFNRVCLKRAHQAISISADPSFHSILFPDRSTTLSPRLHDYRIPSFQDPAKRIANHRGPIPFLLQGQLVTERSPTGRLLQLAMLNIYRANPRCRILVCSPTNNTSDVLLRSLRERIPEASFFRANAAFRDYGLVPDDIVPASLYEEEQECFSCPPLSELLNFNIVTCTFMSSFRLSSAGIDSDHFSHIFLVDACLAIEPEAIVPLANLACGDTSVVVAGCSGKSPGWVRSEIARRNGLKESYFSRLLEREPYRSGDAMFTLQVLD